MLKFKPFIAVLLSGIMLMGGLSSVSASDDNPVGVFDGGSNVKYGLVVFCRPAPQHQEGTLKLLGPDSERPDSERCAALARAKEDLKSITDDIDKANEAEFIDAEHVNGLTAERDEIQKELAALRIWTRADQEAEDKAKEADVRGPSGQY